MDYNRTSPTLYKTHFDLETSLKKAVSLFNQGENLPLDEEGYCPIKYICEIIRKEFPQLYYINRNHIAEFFFKDLVREIRFKGKNLIKIDTFKPVGNMDILKEGLPVASLYENPTDLNSALITAVHLLMNKDKSLDCDKSGYCYLEKLSEAITIKMPYLSYINSNHIVELFFKDKYRKIMLYGPDKIKYKIKRIVEPPEVLYFGTLLNLSRKMRAQGIFSSTKHYIKLYKNKDKAMEKAAKFVTQPRDKLITMKIDAKQAYSDGVKFLTYEDGEYIVSEVKKEYIL